MCTVLILIVVEDGLVLYKHFKSLSKWQKRLNPYCSGRWSRTGVLLFNSLM